MGNRGSGAGGMKGSPTQIARVLALRAAGKPLDENDRAIIGELSSDPFEGTVLVSTPQDVAAIKALLRQQRGK